MRLHTTKIVVRTGLWVGLMFGAPYGATAQSDECTELKRDISEMKADIAQYEKDTELDPADIPELMQEVAALRADLKDYLSDRTSDRQERQKAREGLAMVDAMERGIQQKNLKEVLTQYANIITLYEWFEDYEDCP